MARVLWFSIETPDRDGQGGQRRQFHQIRELGRLGHDVTVLTPHGSQPSASIREVARVVRVRTAIRGRGASWGNRRLRRLFLQGGWDAVIVSHIESARLLPHPDSVPVPVLVDVHNVMSRWHETRGERRQADEAREAEDAVVSHVDAVTTCSEVELRRLLTAHPEAAGRSFAAPLGVDPAEWTDRPLSRDEPVVALFGSWGWHPNAQGLAWFAREVWPAVRALFPGARAEVAGATGDGLDLPDGMTSVGRVPDLAAFLARATVVAVPVRDGVGGAVKFAEALASGAAVIATADGANAFGETPAFVSDDAHAWATWIADRLEHRREEPAPAAGRAFALSELTWRRAVLPLHAWLSSHAPRDGAHPTPSSEGQQQYA
ncbi:glycosyltransferase family 4 protein [Microbacterium marinilacus]|uniref:Glycosyltransferase subfamily 4-like N-terminal domain-containing protein n=1 Tax=Microbacterium marinilacus TaxID=415209 RepID=A0ABP7BPD9_9MICO|nr:glycosyltransferase family 4 protein [Microbacterium marinilacus]MBY0690059.1 glycosyltransferase family 4 protein [Microbacterium marinilacus]